MPKTRLPSATSHKLESVDSAAVPQQVLSPRQILHYLIAILLMSIYGVQVCPFVEELTLAEIMSPLVLIGIVQYVFRYFVAANYIPEQAYEKQATTVFATEWGLFLLSGVFLAAHNTVTYDFPLHSGMKLIVGYLAIGFFVATDLALERDFRVITHLQKTTAALALQSSATLTRKFSLFISCTLILLTTVLFLIINKDLTWLEEASAKIPFDIAQQAIMGELAFVGAIILFFLLLLSHGFTRNLSLRLDASAQTL
ncbi:MAG: hypothetical protein OEZ43_17685 [Gammaproteobacteria bacterium]|nr:hypothetical protein [Gammaproteobacteria bacterium]